MKRGAPFDTRPRDAQGHPVDGWWPCRCGGRFTLDETTTGQPIVLHSRPTCPRYDAVETNADAVRFSQENRTANVS